MAVLSIDIPAGIGARVATAFIVLYPPPVDVPVDTAAEKAAYVKTVLMQHIKDVVRSYEAAVAVEDARQAAMTAAETDIILT